MDRTRQQHGLGADVEDLDDVGRVFLPVSRDGAGENFGVGPLVQRLDLEVHLALVELLDELVDGLPELSAHRVPEVDLGLRECRGRKDDEEQGRQPCDGADPALHESLHGVRAGLIRARCAAL